MQICVQFNTEVSLQLKTLTLIFEKKKDTIIFVVILLPQNCAMSNQKLKTKKYKKCQGANPCSPMQQTYFTL